MPEPLTGRLHRKIAALKDRVYRLLPATWRPGYEHRIGRFTVAFPHDHGMRGNQTIAPSYDRAWRYIVREIARSQPDGVIVDIGANVGATAALVADVCRNRILCVEGCAAFLPYLRRNAERIGPQTAIIEKFVWADELARRDLVFSHTQKTGMFVEGDASSAPSRGEFVTLQDIKRHHCRPDERIAIVKTDTDGLDTYILLENLEFLEREAACLFFEYDPTLGLGTYESCSALIRRLESQGYAVIVFDNHGRLMFHAGEAYAAVIEDLLRWIIFQSRIGIRHNHYLDLWAFPPGRRALFDDLRRRSEAELAREFEPPRKASGERH